VSTAPVFDPQAELSHILVVRDPAASREWYERVLGASVYREYAGTAVLQVLGTWLLLVIGGEPTADKPSVTFQPPAGPDAVSHSMTIRVVDCQATYETLVARGAVFLTPPVAHGRETRAFFRDPDGHLFEISAYR